jgi:hypothetical protein
VFLEIIELDLLLIISATAIMKGKRIRAEHIIWKENEGVKLNKEKGIKPCVKNWIIKMSRI